MPVRLGISNLTDSFTLFAPGRLEINRRIFWGPLYFCEIFSCSAVAIKLATPFDLLLVLEIFQKPFNAAEICFRSFNAADSFNAFYSYRNHSFFKWHLPASVATSGSLPTNLSSRRDVLFIYDCDFARTRLRPLLLIFFSHLPTFPRRQSFRRQHSPLPDATYYSSTTAILHGSALDQLCSSSFYIFSPSLDDKAFVDNALDVNFAASALPAIYSSTPSSRRLPRRLLSDRLNITISWDV